MRAQNDLIKFTRKEVKKYNDEIESLNDQLDEKDTVIDDLVSALEVLVAAGCNIHPTAPSGESIKQLHDAMDQASAAIAMAAGQDADTVPVT